MRRRLAIWPTRLPSALVLAVAIAMLLPSTASAASSLFAIGFGAVAADKASAIVVDGSGNSFVTGEFQGTVDFDPGPDVVNLAAAGNSDVFVARYTSVGDLVWAFAVGGTGTDFSADIALQGTNVIIVGSFSGRADFDPGPTLRRMTSAGDLDAFILRVRQSNGALSWAKRLGAAGSDYAHSVATFDTHVYVGGAFYNTVDFNPGSGVVNRTANSKDAYVLRLAAGDGAFGLVRVIGGSNVQDLGQLETDANGNILIAGHFNGTTDADPGAATVNLTPVGNLDGLVIKLNSSANFSWARQIGGAGAITHATGITNNAAGSVFVVGDFRDTIDFDPGPGTVARTSNGSSDAFAAGYSAAGALTFAASAGSTQFDTADDVAVDSSSRVVLTGGFQGTVDFDPGAGTQNLTAGGDDAFVWHLTGGGVFASAYQLGGTGEDKGFGVTTLGTDVFTVGAFSGAADFDPDGGVQTLNSNGSWDVFVSRVDM